MFSQGTFKDTVLLISYIVLEFLSVILLIEALRGALLSYMAQGIITAIFVFEVVFYRLLQMIYKQPFPVELLITVIVGFIGMAMLLIEPDYMPPVYFSFWTMQGSRSRMAAVATALLYPLCRAV